MLVKAGLVLVGKLEALNDAIPKVCRIAESAGKLPTRCHLRGFLCIFHGVSPWCRYGAYPIARKAFCQTLWRDDLSKHVNLGRTYEWPAQKPEDEPARTGDVFDKAFDRVKPGHRRLRRAP